MVPRGLLPRVRLLRGDVTLGELFDHVAGVRGDRRAVEQPSPIVLAGDARSLTFREAAGIVARAASLITERLAQPGDRVVVQGPNDYGFFLTCIAVARAGGVVIPVNERMRAEEVEHVVSDADATVLDVADLGRRVSAGEGDPDWPALPARSEIGGIFYTSGTTGRPKGARLTHAALVDPARLGSWWPAGLRRDELVASLPIAHIMGFATLVGAAGSGIPVWFLPRFSPRAVLDAIEQRRATVFVGVPAMYRMLLDAGAESRDLRSVRVWVSAADVMPADLARRFKRMGASVTLPLLGASLGEATFAQGYGMVELGGAATAKVSPPLLPIGLGDVLGVSLLGRHMRVVDEDGLEVPPGEIGELLVKGPGVLRGYHGDPERSREILTDDGWVRTGDLARKGPFGIVHFAGRKKDVLMHGGYSVYPAEVEDVLRGCEGVIDVAVVGRPDDVKGEVPVAFVRAEGLSADDVLAYAREHLADFKAPVAVEFVDEFPRTGTGKISKPDLRERLSPPR